MYIILFLLISTFTFAQCSPPSLNGGSTIVSSGGGDIIINDTACSQQGQSSNYNCSEVDLTGDLIINDGECTWIVLNGDWDNIEEYIELGINWKIKEYDNYLMLDVFKHKEICVSRSKDLIDIEQYKCFLDTTVILECGYYYIIDGKIQGYIYCLDDIFIYPNPASDILYIKSAGKIMELTMYKDNTQILYYKGQELVLDVSSYTSGLYVIAISNLIIKIIII